MSNTIPTDETSESPLGKSKDGAQASNEAANKEEKSLAEIYARAVKLAAERLSVMEGEAEPSDFDRGARSVGTLIRTAVQVNALKSQSEKEARAHAADAEPAPLTNEQLEQIRRDIEAQLDRIETGAVEAVDGQCCS